VVKAGGQNPAKARKSLASRRDLNPCYRRERWWKRVRARPRLAKSQGFISARVHLIHPCPSPWLSNWLSKTPCKNASDYQSRVPATGTEGSNLLRSASQSQEDRRSRVETPCEQDSVGHFYDGAPVSRVFRNPSLREDRRFQVLYYLLARGSAKSPAPETHRRPTKTDHTRFRYSSRRSFRSPIAWRFPHRGSECAR
jgi:hypothetical protein